MFIVLYTDCAFTHLCFAAFKPVRTEEQLPRNEIFFVDTPLPPLYYLNFELFEKRANCKLFSILNENKCIILFPHTNPHPPSISAELLRTGDLSTPLGTFSPFGLFNWVLAAPD